jgi:hypothetical protein
VSLDIFWIRDERTIRPASATRTRSPPRSLEDLRAALEEFETIQMELATPP